MRIGFDARLIGALGIGRYIAGLLPALAEILGDRLVVVARRPDVAIVRALTAGRGGLIPCSAHPYRIAEQSMLPLKLAQARLALVHFPHYNLPIAFPGRFVTTIHDLFSYRFPGIHSGVIPRTANHLLIANAVYRAGAIITPSQATADEVGRQFPRVRQRIQPIAEAADSRFSAVRNPAAEASWLHYYRITPPYILYLGQWKTYKNVPLLIEAYRRVRAVRPDCQLVLAGDDPRHPEVPAAADRLPAGSVVLPGRLADDAVPELYRAAAAVVLPSRAEGFGLPVLEALACGVPIVCSDIPVLRELADGVAIFGDPADPASFAEGILTALGRTPGDEAARLGLDRAGEYSWRKAAEQTVAIYERVLAG
ncbi:MAG: glycosyltransferase family 4 protein [Candidatus Dormibacteraeota bacterium]|nr:glycosyltransferase family 4 protein [Candidatus Dormibacteraeota bacterium]